MSLGDKNLQVDPSGLSQDGLHVGVIPEGALKACNEESVSIWNLG